MLEEDRKVAETPVEPTPISTPPLQPTASQPTPSVASPRSNVDAEEFKRVKRELEEFKLKEQNRIEAIALKSSGVKEEYFEDFKNLARMNKNATEKEISEKAVELKKKFPSMFERANINKFKSAGEFQVDSSNNSPQSVVESHDIKKGEIQFGQIDD